MKIVDVEDIPNEALNNPEVRAEMVDVIDSLQDLEDKIVQLYYPSVSELKVTIKGEL